VIDLTIVFCVAITHSHTTVLRLYGFCPGQPGWADTRRNMCCNVGVK